MSGHVKARSYKAIFAQVYAKRMRYVVNVCLLVALMLALVLFSPISHFWHTLVLALTVRGPLLAISLVLVRLAHLRLATVSLSPHKTLAGHCISVITSRADAFIYFALLAAMWNLCYLALLPLVSDAIITPVEYGAMRELKDDVIYFAFHFLWIALVYAAFFLFFQRNLVSLAYGKAHILPDSTLFSQMPIVLINSVLFSMAAAILCPITYYMLKPSIGPTMNFLVAYLDMKMATSAYSWSTYFHLVYSTSVMVFAWELVHHCYGVYASIGCLDGSKPLSSYSSDPVHTLVQALLDGSNPLARATAFQELAWIASCDGKDAVALRTAIFAARTSAGPAWNSIAHECFAIIRDTTASINFRSPADMARLSKPSNMCLSPPTDFVFGNAHSHRQAPLRDDGVTLARGHYYKSPASSVLDYVRFLTNTKTGTGASPSLVRRRPLALSIIRKIDAKIADVHARFLDLWPGLFFRVTPRRDAALRVPVPSIYGNAVLAISNLLIHSISHDKLHVVLDFHIRDVLQVLEVSIRACGNYTDHLPPLVHVNKHHPCPRSHLIAKLLQLSLQQFFAVCVKFNYKLNDLSLNLRTHKKAKEMIELAIEHQNQHRKPFF